MLRVMAFSVDLNGCVMGVGVGQRANDSGVGSPETWNDASMVMPPLCNAKTGAPACVDDHRSRVWPLTHPEQPVGAKLAAANVLVKWYTRTMQAMHRVQSHVVAKH